MQIAAFEANQLVYFNNYSKNCLPKSLKRALKRAPLLCQRAQAGARLFLASERKRERIRHFEERANALNPYDIIIYVLCNIIL